MDRRFSLKVSRAIMDPVIIKAEQILVTILEMKLLSDLQIGRAHV